MKIGIVGAGNIGGTLARLFVRAGHEVMLSNSRGPDSLAHLVAELGEKARAGTVDEASEFGDVVILAAPWRNPDALPHAKVTKGKIVVDAMNPYRADFTLFDLGESTSSEETLKRLPGARLVKAFNTIYFKHLAANGRTDLPPDDRHAIFVATDDPEARAVVSALIDDIGFVAVDTGSLHDGGRLQEPNSEIYNSPMSAKEARRAIEDLRV